MGRCTLQRADTKLLTHKPRSWAAPCPGFVLPGISLPPRESYISQEGMRHVEELAELEPRHASYPAV